MSDIDQLIINHSPYRLGYISDKLSDKLTLIGLICYLTNKLKEKKPDITYLQVLQAITKDMKIDQDFLSGLAVVCMDFAYGCDEFPKMGFEPKEMKAEIQRLLSMQIPF